MGRTPLVHLQETLRKRGLERLTGHYSVKVSPHPKYPSLLQFKYSQIDSPMGSKVVQACRGVILDKDNDWKVACHTFNKFFNHGETHAASIDWRTARVFTKEDGSLMQLWFHNGQWQVSTSGSPDAGGNVGDYGFTFQELFWKTWHELGYEMPQNKNLSYAFELCTKYNRIVVKHEKPRIVFLGARDNEYGYEVFTDYVTQFQKWETVQEFSLNSFADVVESLKSISPFDQEGYIVRDGNFNRQKIKSPQYVAIHHVIGSMSLRNLLEIVRKGESAEFLAHFPEHAQEFNKIKKKYDDFIEEVTKTYNKYKHIKDQKEFALKIKNKRGSGIIFNLRVGRTAKEVLADMPIKRCEELLRIK